jgi:hypothetical protein
MLIRCAKPTLPQGRLPHQFDQYAAGPQAQLRIRAARNRSGFGSIQRRMQLLVQFRHRRGGVSLRLFHGRQVRRSNIRPCNAGAVPGGCRS